MTAHTKALVDYLDGRRTGRRVARDDRRAGRWELTEVVAGACAYWRGYWEAYNDGGK